MHESSAEAIRQNNYLLILNLPKFYRKSNIKLPDQSVCSERICVVTGTIVHTNSLRRQRILTAYRKDELDQDLTPQIDSFAAGTRGSRHCCHDGETWSDNRGD